MQTYEVKLAGAGGGGALLVRLPQSAAAQAAALEVEAAWREPAEAGERARWERVEAENEDGSVTLRADLDGEGKLSALAPAPRYALARLNKATGVATLYDVSGGIVAMRPALADELHKDAKARAAAAEKRAAAAAAEGENERVAKRALVDAFGSTKSGRKLKAAERALVDADALASRDALEEMVGKVADDGGAGREQMDAAAAAAARNVPPHDEAATEVAKCYPLERLFDEEEWECLDVPNIVALGKKCAAPAGGAAARRKAKEDGWHGVVVERLATLDGAGADEAAQRARLLWALQACIGYYKAGAVSGSPSELAERLQVPELLAAGMLDKFATAKAGGGGGVRYHRDKRQHQLVGTYAAVLLLHLDSFAFDANAYAAELKLSQKDCTARLRELGCTVERRRKDGESRATARLKAPLAFPKIKRGAAPK